MVQEIRHIRFTDREVAAAVTMYLSDREENPVGSEEIAEIKVADSLDVKIRLKARRLEQPKQLTLPRCSSFVLPGEFFSRVRARNPCAASRTLWSCWLSLTPAKLFKLQSPFCITPRQHQRYE